MMRSALVTGGGGFIGGHLVEALRGRGVDVTILGRTRQAGRSDAEQIVLDADGSAAAFARVLDKVSPDVVFHLAGLTRGAPAELIEDNVNLTRSLLDALRKAGARIRLVAAGSAAEYGSAIRDGEPIRETAIEAPLSDYGAAKLAQTRAVLAWAQETGRSAVVARIFNPLGVGMPRHLAIRDFAEQIAAMPQVGGRLSVGDIDVRRDWIDVAHVADLLCRLAEAPEAEGVVNLCSGEARPLRDLVALLIRASGKTVALDVDEARIRGREVRTIVGDVDRLSALVGRPPKSDFSAIAERIWRSVEPRRGVAS